MLATGITLAPASLVAILVTDFLASKGVCRMDTVALTGLDVVYQLLRRGYLGVWDEK